MKKQYPFTITKHIIFSAVRAALLIAALLLSLCGCGSKAPSLDEVKDTFCALIDASREVNDIFFGAGLPTYPRVEGNNIMSYDEASGTYYIYYEDSDFGRVLKYYDSTLRENKYLAVKTFEGGAVPDEGYVYQKENDYYYTLEDYSEPEWIGMYDSSSPVYYDYVRDDCAYQSVDDIKALAEKVYSKAYLNSVYTTVFDGFAEDGIGLVRARYMVDESGNSGFFLKSNEFEPYFEKQTEYDYSTMRVLSSSSATRVTVEMDADGKYLDYDTLEVKDGRMKKQLTFVFEGGEWRLDTPTY